MRASLVDQREGIILAEGRGQKAEGRGRRAEQHIGVKEGCALISSMRLEKGVWEKEGVGGGGVGHLSISL